MVDFDKPMHRLNKRLCLPVLAGVVAFQRVEAAGSSRPSLVIILADDLGYDDNGPWLTQGTNGGVAGPLRGGKGSTYEGGVREPAIAWWPGHVPAGSACYAVAANFDFLPTFVKLAGGAVPMDRKMDGKDISPLLLGEKKTSPHAAHYYFTGNKLQAVRSGPWKLAITARAREVPDDGKPFTPRLYNLDDETGEQTDVSAQHADVVKRLQGLVAQMDADLGTTNIGPRVRPPGRVENPIGLWLPGHEPKHARVDTTSR